VKRDSSRKSAWPQLGLLRRGGSQEPELERIPGSDECNLLASDDVVITVRNLRRQFPGPGEPVDVLRSVDLDVARGSSIALMGASGSGKTTLLNLIAGLDRPSSGCVAVLGERVDQLSDGEAAAFRARHLGLVFQDPHLLPGLSALENVVIARLPWEAGQVLQARARSLLARVGLGDREGFPPALLSGGERQRVGIARALLGSPEVLLADEPTGNLDEQATTELLDLLEKLKVETQLTLIIATHDPVVADRATVVCRLRNGTLECT
jgi:predicted ABC-type transport system involved in lysophospholipase L1 biosynthesis ATPase subunit